MNDSIEQQVSIDGRQLVYRVRFNRRRKTRSVISIHADGEVWVDCPLSVNLLQVQSWVVEKAAWVLRRRAEIESGAGFATPLSYREGAPHLFLGQTYFLRPVRRSAAAPAQGIAGQNLHLSVTRLQPEQVKARLWGWYREQAQQIFQQRLHILSGQIDWLRQAPELRLRKMRRRWGSCSSTGVITLNTHLIKAPESLSDYVILHELCHLREHNHSPRFYRLMDQVLPSWRAAKRALDAQTTELGSE